MVQIKVCRFRPYLTLTLESGKKAFQNCIVIKIDFTRSHVQVNNETTCKGTLHETYRGVIWVCIHTNWKQYFEFMVLTYNQLWIILLDSKLYTKGKISRIQCKCCFRICNHKRSGLYECFEIFIKYNARQRTSRLFVVYPLQRKITFIFHMNDIHTYITLFWLRLI